MSRPQDPKALARLVRIAALKRDAALGRLARAAHEETRARDALAALGRPALPPDGAQGQWQAHQAHARWCDHTARHLNSRIAAARARVIDARPAALEAFGRAEVLTRLAHRANECDR